MSALPDPSVLDQGGPADRPFVPFPASALDASICARFAVTACQFSSCVALSDRASTLTYGELADMVRRIAAATAVATAGRSGPVAILLPNAVSFPAAMLGSLAAGRGFVPLDPANPDERNRMIAERSGAAAVLTAGALIAHVRALFGADLPAVDIDALDAAVGEAELPAPRADDLAFIVYTSGSTGKPKGAFHNHRNLLHDVMQQTNSLHVNETDRVALVYSPTVIGAIREMMMALLNGASLHILPPRELGPEGLVTAIEQRGITIFRTVPVLLRRLAETMAPAQKLASVRVLGLGSQRVDWSDYDVFRRCCTSQARLIVGIGSTECGGNFCHWFVDESIRIAGARLPIGRILPDAAVTIVDQGGRAVAAGEVGEFVVASRYLALGYWRDPEATAGTFGIDPKDGAIRTFRTGDTGRLRPDGLIEFAGRDDQQIKLRGHRIELGEIEFALAGCEGVEEAAVVVRRDQAGLPGSLAAYVEFRAGGGLTPRELRRRLIERLPQYMIPATIRTLDGLPRLPNLKIDRAELARVDAAQAAQTSLAIDDPLVAELIGIFEAVIGGVRATADDNVLTLGGDSLQAIRVALALEARFAVKLPIDVFEAAHTIRELASFIATARAASASPVD